MNKLITIIIVIFISASACCGQSFLDKYPKIKTKNLTEFIIDWKHYSDSIDFTVECNSPICNIVNSYLDSTFYFIRTLQGGVFDWGLEIKPRYGVIPQNIPVEYYPTSIDPDSTIFSLYQDIMVTDTLIPKLRTQELYLTKDIEDKLMEFITGCDVKSHRPYKLIDKNIKALIEFIRYNGEYYGWVDFNDYPRITKIQATPNIIILHIKDSNNTGYEQWYIKTDDEFVKAPEPKNQWCE